MNMNELRPLVVEVKEDDIPSVITSQFAALKKVQASMDAAQTSVENAQKAAADARGKVVGIILGHKPAIESTQNAVKKLAEAQTDMIDAQKYSFEYQEKLADITKYLFQLGVSSITMNRAVVREVSLRLQEASQEELDGLAQQELMNVLKQLKAQEDIMVKQENIEKKQKKLADRLNEQDVRNAEQDRLLAEVVAKDVEQDHLIEEQVAKDAEYDRLIAEQAAKDAEHDRLIEEQAAKDAEHDRLIAEQAAKDAEHDHLLEEQAAKDAEHDRLIEEQAAKDAEHDRLIAESLSKNVEQDKHIQALQAENADLKLRLEAAESEFQKLSDYVMESLDKKTGKTATVISYIMAGIGIVMALIQFII